jgi:ABC-type glycerol-3-phosphate transport system substrate-binding protein
MEREPASRNALTGVLRIFLVSALLGTCAFAQRTQITYAFWGAETELELSNQLKEQFEAANPDIEVKLQQVDSEEYEQRLLIQIASGTAPDVMVIRDASSVFFARRGLYADLNPLIETRGMDLSAFAPETLEAYQLDGEQYGLPRSVTPVLTYYNKKMFDDAGVAYPERTGRGTTSLRRPGRSPGTRTVTVGPISGGLSWSRGTPCSCLSSTATAAT